MIIMENIFLALSSLLANRMRALLTMLGIIIGIGSVIAIMTVGNSLTGSVTASMESMGAGNIQVGLEPKDWERYEAMSDAQKADLENYFTLDMLKKLTEANREKIRAVSVSSSGGNGRAKAGKRYSNVGITGVNAGYFAANQVKLLAGNGFGSGEYEKGKSVALISDRAAEELFLGGQDAALGKEVEVSVDNRYTTYTIVGIYKYENASLETAGKERSTKLYAPVRSVLKQTKAKGYEGFTVVAQKGVDTKTFGSAIADALNPYFEKKDIFRVSAFSMEAMAAEMTKMISTTTLAITVIAGIALLVGGIGVMNIMMVSITERTREIGTRKALGATNGSIRLQFIVEAVMICLTGGMIGIVLGIILGSIASHMMGYRALPTAGSILISLGFSMTIGIFFGFYPANKAARMNPIDALRYE